MELNNWPFKDQSNVMIMTTKNIVNNRSPILSVWHEEDDGMWQFLDGSDVSTEDAMIISLKEILSIDYSIKDIADLPLGWVAWREKKGAEWKRKCEK